MAVDPGLQTEIKITGSDGESYIFRVPSLTDQVTLGFRARKIRRDFDKESWGDMVGLDNFTHQLIMAFATFETQLQAGPGWVYGNDVSADKQPVVDYRKFPANKETVLLEVFLKYEQETLRFRKDGSAADAAPA